MRLFLFVLLAGCWADPAEPEAVQRCPTVAEPEIDSVLADADPALATAHQKLRELMAVRFPVGLDFDPARPAEVERSKTEFKDFLARLALTGRDSVRAYQAAGPRGCAGATASYQWTAHVIETGPIPELIDGEYRAEMVQAYCGELREHAAEIRERITPCAKTD